MRRDFFTMPSTIAKEIEKAASQHPNGIALEMEKQGSLHSYTFKDWVEAGGSFSAVLRKAGIPPGARMILICENSPELFIAMYALFQCQCTIVLLDPTLSLEETRKLIREADPQGFAVSSQTSVKLPEDLQRLPAFLVDQNYATPLGFARALSPDLPQVKDGDSDIAFMLFTSGTTSLPKAAMLEHDAVLHAIYAMCERVPIQTGERTVQILPIFHIAPLTASLGVLFSGSGLRFLEKIDGPVIVQVMASVKPKQQLVVPRLLEFFQQRISEEVRKQGPLKEKIFFSLLGANGFCKDKLNLNLGPVLFKKIHNIFGGHVENMVSGGSALSLDTFRFFENIGFKISEGYGLTETSGGVTMTSPANRVPGSVGHAIRDVDIIIRSEGDSNEGEILIKSPSLMRGYFRDPGRTAESLKDGWFHTGDLGRFDEHNNLYVTGRVKEMIMTSGGKKISPATVESQYQNIPGIKELAVAGVPKGAHNADTIVGFVVLDADHAAQHQLDEAQLLKKIEAAVRERAALMPFHYRIQHIKSIKDLPKTSLGKVKRYELKKLSFEAADTEAPEPEARPGDLSVSERRLIEKISAFCDEPQKVMQLSLSELGLDSLGLAEVQQLIEAEFHMSFSNTQLLGFSHTRELLEAIAARKSSEAQTIRKKAAETAGMKLGGMKHQTAFTAISQLSRIFWNIQVQGQEHIPRSGNFILFANHESHLDPLWISSFLPTFVRDKLSTLGKKEHWDNPFSAFIADMLGGIPVDREGDVLQAMNAAFESLRAGNCLLLFPEGTRSRNGKMGAFKRGVAKLALETKIPLLPVAIKGAWQIYPPHKTLPSFFNWSSMERHRLTLVFGRPIQLDTRSGGLQEEQILLMELEESIRQLLHSGLRQDAITS
jgi:long-chain acyl-CoA synthetase